MKKKRQFSMTKKNLARVLNEDRVEPKKKQGRISKFNEAAIQIHRDSGKTNREIADEVGLSTATVRKYKEFDAPEEAQEIVEFLKEKELQQMHLITGKCRIAVNKYLDEIMEGKREINPIAVTAIQDRNFQQRQLLEGRATSNVNLVSLHDSLAAQQEQLTREIEELQKEVDEENRAEIG